MYDYIKPHNIVNQLYLSKKKKKEWPYLYEIKWWLINIS